MYMIIVSDVSQLSESYTNFDGVPGKLYQWETQGGSTQQTLTIPNGGGIAFYASYDRGYSTTLKVQLTL